MRKNDYLKDNLLFLKRIEKRLARRRIPSASAEAETLVRHFGRINRLDLFTGRQTLKSQAKNLIEKILESRLEGEPLSYLLKEADFFGRPFFVTKDTLIPRLETELLVEEAVKILQRENRPSPRILDIGTGCGCIAVSLTMERPDCRMTALDISSSALKVARKNIHRHVLSRKIRLIKSDLFNAFGEKEKGSWDMIVSNPPYVPREDFPTLSREVLSEPRLALDGGLKGFQVINRLLEESPYFLKKGGSLLVEVGKGQSKFLGRKISRERRFRNLRFIKDYSGIDRILVAEKWTN